MLSTTRNFPIKYRSIINCPSIQQFCNAKAKRPTTEKCDPCVPKTASCEVPKADSKCVKDLKVTDCSSSYSSSVLGSAWNSASDFWTQKMIEMDKMCKARGDCTVARMEVNKFWETLLNVSCVCFESYQKLIERKDVKAAMLYTKKCAGVLWQVMTVFFVAFKAASCELLAAWKKK